MISTFESCLPGKSILKNGILKKGLLKRALLPCLALLLLASCATRMRIPEDLEPERLLPAGALAYVRVNPAKTEELILPLIEPYGIAQSKDLMMRTESMVIAVMPPGESLGVQTGRPVVFGVVSGNFPTGSIALKLNTDRHWAKETPGWVHKTEGFRVALASRGKIILGTGPLEPMLSTGQERPHPVPEFWSTAWDNDLAVYIPEPLSFLGSSLPVDLGGLPLESMLISIRRIEARYDVFLGFEFATERMALIFAPLCRLFLYALTRTLWPAQATEILAAVAWSTQGFTVKATGLRLEVSQLSSLLALPLGESLKVPIRTTGGSR